MSAFAAVLFDLFDTLVMFDRDRLPLVEVDGRQIHSTVGLLHAVVREHAPAVTLQACYETLIESWREAEHVRATDHREVPAPERFRGWLRRLAIDPASCPAGLVTTLLETHRRELTNAAEFPAHHRPLLTRLAERFRLAVVSNFDYSPTAIGILEAAGVVPLFDAIVVSDAIGWRKPKREIFEVALSRLGVAPGEALFVGDRADIDVLGAHDAGIPVAWINRVGEPLPAGVAPPTFEIRDLGELGPILGLDPR
jgi:HAD superfamily hydrolase (TIGR01509 family)